MSTLTEIRSLAEHAHEGQIDPDGAPHFEHVLRVAEAVDGFEETAVALLHDVLEDTQVKADDLRDMSVPAGVIRAVELLTREDAMPYSTYIERLTGATGRAAQLARTVKRAELRDNLRRSQASADLPRIAKYQQALAQLAHV